MNSGSNSRTNNGNSIDDDILKIIKSSDRPVSTREISLRTKRAWHSIKEHCLELKNQGKIKDFKFGNNTVWMIDNDKK